MYPDDPQQSQYPEYPYPPQQPRDPSYPQYPPQPGQYQPYSPYPLQRPQSPAEYPAHPQYPQQPSYYPQYPPQPYPPYSGPIYPPPMAPQRPPTRRRSHVMARLAVSLLVSLLVACVSLTGLALALAPQTVAQFVPIAATQMTGTIYGENLAQRVAGRESPTPIAHATIDCGAARASADARGHYTLRLLRGRSYTCDVSAPLYMPTQIKLSPRLASAYRLDLGPAIVSANVSAPGCVSTAKGEVCPALMLLGGALTGQVTNLRAYTPIANAQVLCWDNSAAAQASASQPARYVATTDAHGYYTLANTPPGPYLCVANQQGAPQPTSLKPGVKTTLNFAECGTRCGGVAYHSGPVMHTFRAYIIFWAPPGVNFEPYGSNAHFQSLVKQYFTDVGGSRFYGLLTQYWDLQGPVRNNVTLGGAYVDTRAYPHAGTRADALTDSDIITEISLVREKLGWKVTPGAAFIMVTGYNVEECAKFSDGTTCSFPTGANNGFCAYHSFTPYYGGDGTSNYAPYIYAVNNSSCAYLPTFDSGSAPYGDQVADAIINLLSHEQFETVTDPETGGWYSGDPSGGEIADKCETSFGPVNADGSTVTLSHGHRYALQEEYSNRLGACSYH